MDKFEFTPIEPNDNIDDYSSMDDRELEADAKNKAAEIDKQGICEINDARKALRDIENTIAQDLSRMAEQHPDLAIRLWDSKGPDSAEEDNFYDYLEVQDEDSRARIQELVGVLYELRSRCLSGDSTIDDSASNLRHAADLASSLAIRLEDTIREIESEIERRNRLAEYGMKIADELTAQFFPEQE